MVTHSSRPPVGEDEDGRGAVSAAQQGELAMFNWNVIYSV
jgi:hypothetical protein